MAERVTFLSEEFSDFGVYDDLYELVDLGLYVPYSLFPPVKRLLILLKKKVVMGIIVTSGRT